ncbi:MULTISPECIES: hypothetical protein [Sinomonas]|uniref:HNH endonuclease n=1 Tax=Sinomonas terrae TaxID=2908838 RepID=A0ABS9U1N6_9MICC|nr:MULTISPECIES: hypothetical protein [Sinomonas]MCH6470609.1 hypothetical protein [Sinomonas terrae]
MSEEAVPSVDLGRLEGLVERLEEAAVALAASEGKLVRTLEAMRERDRAAAFDAWRRGQ